MATRYIGCLGFFCTWLVAGLASAEKPALMPRDLAVLERPARNMMQAYLTARIDRQFARRAALLATLHTAADWDRRAAFIRRSMAQWTGPFPSRTPLRARVTGTLDRSDYRLEKVVFESRPGFLVTANLYLPKHRASPCPAVLNVIGHSSAGKATDKVQRRCIMQARLGFVALAIDALGQGERQIRAYAKYGHPPGNAHQIIGTQAFLAGTHVFNIMLWDAIRAIDYLVSRPEVDPKRIACTGCSGGGMMTTYILPFEPRITVAIPACNPNTWSYRVHAGLATDHEQVFPGAFAAGIDPRGDPLFCHVPKPLLIDATTRDNLNPPAGVRDLSRWLEKAYAAHRAGEEFKSVMIEGPHGYNRQQREAAYRWMLKWLAGSTATPTENDFPVEAERDTWCTPNGNVYTSAESRLPHALVLDYFHKHRPTWPAVTTSAELQTHKKQVRQKLLHLLDLPPTVPVPEATMRPARALRDLRLTPIVLRPERGIRLPAVLIDTPEMPAGAPVTLYIHDQGKAALAEGNSAARLVGSKSRRVLAVDLRGTGETAPGQENKFWDFLSGQTIFAQRVNDIRYVLRWLAQSPFRGTDVRIEAHGVSALYAAVAAALEDHTPALLLEQPLLSFADIVTVNVPEYRNRILIAGLLEQLDLPQIYQACCPAAVSVVQPLRGDKTNATAEQIKMTYRPVAATYAAAKASDRWRVVAR